MKMKQNLALTFLVAPILILSGCASQQESTKTTAQTNAVEPVISKDNSDLRNQKMIFFDFDKSLIKSKYSEIVQAHASYLVDNPKTNIKLEGHCDKRGTPDYNVALGERRAKSVSRALQGYGVSSSQIEVVSYGEREPLVNEDNDAAYAKNRRVVFDY